MDMSDVADEQEYFSRLVNEFVEKSERPSYTE